MRESLEDRLDNILQDEKAENTTAAYEKGIKYFWVWADFAKGLEASYPISEELLMEYVLDHIEGLPDDIDRKLIECGAKRTEGKHKVTTVRSKLRALAYIHNKLKYDNPCDSKKIRTILSVAQKKEAKAGITRNQKRAIIKPMLEQMIKNINTRTVVGLRNRALLEFMFYSGGRRRSEGAAALFKYLTQVKGGYEYVLHHSKTDQFGKGEVKLIRNTAAKSMKSYLDATKITDGYLFRKIKKNLVTNKPMTGHEINLIVKDCVEAIGENPKHYGAHSLRRGFITECGRKKIPIQKAMECSGHKKIETALIYHEQGDIYSNAATKL